nr:MAG TPA: hypothetical protein [Caudoviricetes sp.]
MTVCLLTFRALPKSSCVISFSSRNSLNISPCVLLIFFIPSSHFLLI